MSDNVEIGAVLDSSAMLSYARGHVHVGELIVEIGDGDVRVGLPAVALVDAYRRMLGDDVASARLGVLAVLPGVRALQLGPGEAAAVAEATAESSGDLARGHAVWAALEYGAYFLTTEPQLAPPVLAPGQVHPIPDEDNRD